MIRDQEFLEGVNPQPFGNAREPEQTAAVRTRGVTGGLRWFDHDRFATDGASIGLPFRGSSRCDHGLLLRTPLRRQTTSSISRHPRAKPSQGWNVCAGYNSPK